MSFKLLNRAKNIISDFIKRTYKAIKERDLYSFVDLIIIWSVIFVILFCAIYKVGINVEDLFWHTHTLVMQEKIKNSLPQFYFFFLLGLAFIKLIINIRRSNIRTSLQVENKEKEYIFKLFRKNFKISEKKISSLCLIAIILLFFFIKIPYWDLSFTINHPLKYSTYAEPALKMFELKDPFVMQTQYMHNPLTDSRGVGMTFGNLPILEWLLYIGYSLLHNVLSLETITRMVMCIVGAFALSTIFFFIRKAFNKTTALVATTILAINQIFNLSSFVTVYDTINIGLTFLAFLFILNFNENHKFKELVYAGLILGIGAAIKENILLWALPTVIILLIKRHGKFAYYLSSLATVSLISLLPIFLTKWSINYFPTKELKYFAFFFIGVTLISAICIVIVRFQDKIQHLFEKIWEFTLKYKILFILPIILLILGIKVLYSSNISEEFLTDTRLLLNIDLYIEFLNNQAIPYVGIFVTFLAILSCLLLPMYEKFDKRNKVLTAMLFGSIVYIIIASKVLFFHSYYWLFIIIGLTLLGTKGLIISSQQFSNSFVRKIFLLATIFSLSLPMIGGTRSKLNREIKSIYQVVDYINNQDFTSGTSFIDQGDLTYVSFKTDLYRVYDPGVFADVRFKDSVKDIGLAQTMGKFKIKYLMTSGGKLPDYMIFANSFVEKPLATTSYRRTDMIYATLYPTQYSYYPDQEEREDILNTNNIAKQFYIVKNFKDYTIYGLTPACFNVMIK